MSLGLKLKSQMLDLGREHGNLLLDLLLDLGLPRPGVLLDELGDVEDGLGARNLDLVVLVGQLVEHVLGHLEKEQIDGEL